MTEALVAHDPALAAPMKPEQLVARMKLIQDVQRNVMRKDEHYGKIPGTDKPTLYKPGAEMLLVTFRLAAVEPIVEDLAVQDEVRYRVKVPIETPTGQVVAIGVGECSSNEEKYRWRKPVYRSKEWEETPEDRRREVWKGGRDSAYKLKQVRTNPADVANTILKMAHKRGLIHATLLATAASSMFTQDLEDLPEEVREGLTGDPRESAPQEPQRKSQPNGQQQKPATSPPDAAAAKTSSAAAAPPQETVTRGVKVLKTSLIQDDKGDLYEVETTRGVFYTRDKNRYDEAASCEEQPTVLAITWHDAKRKVKDKLVAIKAIAMIALDEQPEQAQQPELLGGEGNDA